jgi:hypothetical protein
MGSGDVADLRGDRQAQQLSDAGATARHRCADVLVWHDRSVAPSVGIEVPRESRESGSLFVGRSALSPIQRAHKGAPSIRARPTYRAKLDAISGSGESYAVPAAALDWAGAPHSLRFVQGAGMTPSRCAQGTARLRGPVCPLLPGPAPLACPLFYPIRGRDCARRSSSAASCARETLQPRRRRARGQRPPPLVTPRTYPAEWTDAGRVARLAGRRMHPRPRDQPSAITWRSSACGATRGRWCLGPGLSVVPDRRGDRRRHPARRQVRTPLHRNRDRHGGARATVGRRQWRDGPPRRRRAGSPLRRGGASRSGRIEARSSRTPITGPGRLLFGDRGSKADGACPRARGHHTRS